MNATMIKIGRFLPVILASIFSLTTFAADTSGGGNNGQPAAGAEKSGSTRRQLEELLNAYQGLLTNKNIDAILELYSADPVFMPEYAPPAVGREAVRKAYEWVFANLNLEGKFIFHEAEVIGDSAWVRTNSSGRLTVVATGAKADVANSEFFLFKREDGAWKIHRYIFTASAPPPQAK